MYVRTYVCAHVCMPISLILCWAVFLAVIGGMCLMMIWSASSWAYIAMTSRRHVRMLHGSVTSNHAYINRISDSWLNNVTSDRSRHIIHTCTTDCKINQEFFDSEAKSLLTQFLCNLIFLAAILSPFVFLSSR